MTSSSSPGPNISVETSVVTSPPPAGTDRMLSGILPSDQ